MIWVLIAVIGICILGWIMHFTDPDTLIFLILFFISVAIVVYSFSFIVTNTIRRSCLITIGIVGILLLRMFNLRDIYYPALLAGCLISLELYFQKQ